jgi:hypothetical protein
MTHPHIQAHLKIGAKALPRAKRTAVRAVVQLEFTIDGRPLGASEQWSSTAELAGTGLASCLIHLPRGDERLLVSLSSAIPHHDALSGGDQVTLRSQDAAYLRFALAREAGTYAFFAYGDEDNRTSELILETKREWVDELVSLGWDWYSFRGYVVQRPSAALVSDFIQRRNPDLRRRRELEHSVCVFEDWADGTALRISSLQLSEWELAARVDMNAIQRALRTTGQGT